MRRHLTIARWMVVVAVVAADLALLRLFLSTGEGLGGLLAAGWAFSAALLLAMLGRGRSRRFALGFLKTGTLFVLGFFAVLFCFPDFANRAFLCYLNGVLRLVPSSAPRTMTAGAGNSSILVFLFVEIAIGLPHLALASLGGALALWAARRSPEGQPSPLSVDPS